MLADGWVVLLTAWLLSPLRHRGYGLAHDMVFTPRQPFTRDSLGLGSAAPRAVPLDALVALASHLADGQVIGRIALAVPLLLAGWGCVRLLGVTSLPAQLVTAGFAVWNPYVVERLALGQWALLWAYGALPWLIRACLRLRAGRLTPSLLAGLFCCLAAAAITPTGALIGGAVAVALTAGRAARRTLWVLGAAVGVQLPWLLPALASSATATSDPRAVAAFAARAERPGGAWLSVLGLGGIWSSDVVPGSRSGVLGYLTTAAVVGVVILALPRLSRRWVVVSAVGLVLAVAATVPGSDAVVRWAVRDLPGAGLLRDGQKWLMPFAVLAAVAAGLAVERLARWVTGSWLWPVLVAGLVLPLVLLPDAAATLRTPLTPVTYPAGWQQIADRVDGSATDVLVLPFASYRVFPWGRRVSVIDPAPRWFDAGVVVQDRLAVGGAVLAGEDRRAAAMQAFLSDPPSAARLATGLAARGIGWVVVEAGTPGPALPALTGLSPVVTTAQLRLYRVPGTVSTSYAGRFAPGRAARWLIELVDLGIALLVLVAAAEKVSLVFGKRARRT